MPGHGCFRTPFVPARRNSGTYQPAGHRVAVEAGYHRTTATRRTARLPSGATHESHASAIRRGSSREVVRWLRAAMRVAGPCGCQCQNLRPCSGSASRSSNRAGGPTSVARSDSRRAGTTGVANLRRLYRLIVGGIPPWPSHIDIMMSHSLTTRARLFRGPRQGDPAPKIGGPPARKLTEAVIFVPRGTMSSAAAPAALAHSEKPTCQ